MAVVLAALPAAVSCAGHGDGGPGTGPGTEGPDLGSAGDRLIITTDNGLRLRPADGDRVTVDDRVEHRWSHHDHTWTLDLSCPDPGDDGTPCPRMPQVDVPGAVGVTVSARNAGIDVAGVAAALDLTTVNGDVTLTRSGRDGAAVRLSTHNGSVRASALTAGRVTGATTNGDVVLACATAPAGVTAATTNGSVDVTVPHDSPAYRVTAGTENGHASVSVPGRNTGHGPAMTLTTVNGDIDVRRD